MMWHVDTKALFRTILLTLALCAVLSFVVACGDSDELQMPTPTAQILSQAINPIWYVPPSIDEQILTSAVIIRASLLSATAETETVSSDDGVAPTFRPLQKLRFTAHEYLKGSGPTEAIVIVRGEHTYLTEIEAQEVAEWTLSSRNTAWDGRQGVLFLRRSFPVEVQESSASGASGQTSTQVFRFTMSNYEVQSEWDYSINSLSRAWLPSENTPSVTGQSLNSGGERFIIDGSETPYPVISLSDLRSRVAEIAMSRRTAPLVAV